MELQHFKQPRLGKFRLWRLEKTSSEQVNSPTWASTKESKAPQELLVITLQQPFLFHLS